MFPDAALGGVVIVGLFGMFGHDGVELLRSVHRVLRPGGILIVEAQGASHAIFTELSRGGPGARAIFREPERYYLRRILEEGFQPKDPEHLANYEYRFWRPEELVGEFQSAGFSAKEVMSVAPILGSQDLALKSFRRDRSVWANLILTEEDLGHRPECWGGGHAYLISALRKRAG